MTGPADVVGAVRGRWPAGLLGSLRRSLSPRRLAPRGDEAAASLGEVVRHFEAGRYREAAASARRLADAQERELGGNHPDYAATLGTLALSLQRDGDLAGAEPLLRRALEITGEALGEDHPDYATGLNNLAELLHLRGDLGGAEALLRRSLEVGREALGDRHPDYAAGLSSLASLMQRRGDLAGSETLLREVLEIRREALGEGHPSYATGLNNLALVLQQGGDLGGAEPLLRQALAIREGLLGEGHPDSARAANSLAALLWARGELDEALPHYERALAVFRAALGESHPDYATGLNNLALLLRDRGDRRAAEPLLRQALEVRRAALGESHPDYATGLNNLALLLRDRGDRAGAEPLLRQALEIRRAVLGESHPDTAAAAEALEAVNRSIEAARAPAAGQGGGAVIDAPGAGPSPPDGRSLAAGLAALSSRMAEVGGRLAEEARRMLDPGLPPDVATLDAAAGCRRDFARLRGDVLRLAGSMGVPLGEGDPEVACSGRLAGLLDAAALVEAERALWAEVRRRAAEALGRVSRLVGPGPEPAPALLDCQARARLLLGEISGRPATEAPAPEVAALAGGGHAFSALLTLVERGDELGEEDWARLHDAVREGFGKSLAVSVARRRVVPGATMSPPGPTPGRPAWPQFEGPRSE